MKNKGTLRVSLPGDCEIALRRGFKAPRQLVYDAFSKPEILKTWFGPRGWSLIACHVDARVGGGFRFVLRSPEGHELGMRGVYRELSPPERSVHTESFDDFPGESVVTAVFTERDGETTLIATILYPSREVRDAVITSGMEHGAAEGYDKLEEMLVPAWSDMKRMAHTAPYDLMILADTQSGKPLPVERWAQVAAPTLIAVGSKGEPFFHSGAKALADCLAAAQVRSLEGLDHSAVLMAPAPR